MDENTTPPPPADPIVTQNQQKKPNPFAGVWKDKKYVTVFIIALLIGFFVSQPLAIILILINLAWYGRAHGIFKSDKDAAKFAGKQLGIILITFTVVVAVVLLILYFAGVFS
ncbi:MAG: hypothetical protein ACREBF_00445 [Candidatus Micrarchaeales archaeon]